MKRYLTILALVASLSCHDAAGPGNTHRLQIESNTTWSGSLGGSSNTQSYDGSGNGSIEYWGDVCYALQKSTAGGYLSARFEETSRGAASTTAAYGVISGCNY